MGKIVFKEGFDVMLELKKKGYNPQRIRDEKLLSQSTLTDLRKGVVPLAKLPALCEMLNKQPGYFIKYESDRVKEGEKP